MKKTYQEKEKEKNLKLIMSVLKKKRKVTKLELSKKLNLSIPTVTKFINELLNLGIVFEAELSESSGGRRPLVFEFVPDSLLSISIKLELNYLQIALINLDGNIIKRKTINKNFIENKDIIKILIQEIKIFIFEIGILKEKLYGIGISIPGIVSDNELLLKVGTNFKLRDINFEVLQNELNLRVHIENEANCAAIAELFKNKNKNISNILVISIGTGIGAGIIIDNRLYRGQEYRAGEAGHITLYPHGNKCNCGNEGCWELYCSDTALIKQFKNVFPDINSLKDIFSNKITCTKEFQELIKTFTSNMAIGIRDLMLIFDPNKIIISGDICNYSKYIKSDLELLALKTTNFYDTSNKKIEFSSYKSDANLIGAGILAFSDFFSF
jgi:predicted NBD/HSP70 family sugar kinase